MRRDTVELIEDYNSNGEIVVAVGRSGEKQASSEDIELEFDERGLLKIQLPDETDRLSLKCVANGEWMVEDRW